jgi:hypothetical protein
VKVLFAQNCTKNVVCMVFAMGSEWGIWFGNVGLAPIVSGSTLFLTDAISSIFLWSTSIVLLES